MGLVVTPNPNFSIKIPLSIYQLIIKIFDSLLYQYIVFYKVNVRSYFYL